MFPVVQVEVPHKIDTTEQGGDIDIEFNFEKNEFVLVDGQPKEIDGVKAVQQWIELFIRVEKDRYKIYSDKFGCDFSDLAGYRLPRSYQVSEIIRRLDEGIKNNCPHVTNVYDWDFNNGTFSFTVDTDFNQTVEFNI